MKRVARIVGGELLLTAACILAWLAIIAVGAVHG